MSQFSDHQAGNDWRSVTKIIDRDNILQRDPAGRLGCSV
jgi:hypothetical protein